MKITLRKAFALSTALSQYLHSNSEPPIKVDNLNALDLPPALTSPSLQGFVANGLDAAHQELKNDIRSRIQRLTDEHQTRIVQHIEHHLQVCDLIQAIRSQVAHANFTQTDESQQTIAGVMAKKASIEQRMYVLSAYTRPYPKHNPSLDECIEKDVATHVNNIINSLRVTSSINSTVAPIRQVPETVNRFHTEYQSLKGAQSACIDWLAYANNRFTIELSPEQISLVRECHLGYIIE